MIAGLVAVFVAISLTLGGEGTNAAPRIPHFTMWIYKVTIGVKGGATLDGKYPPARPADASRNSVLEEHWKGSFFVDTTFPSMTFAVGQVPGNRNSFGDTQRAVINGTWTNSGTKWIDPDHGITGPFSCSGRIHSSIPSPSTVINVSKKGASLNFKLEVPADELTSPGDCPSTYGANGSMSYANGRAYVTKFSLSTRDLGKKTITKQISGPLANLAWHQYTCNRCTFTMAWHGVVKFTLTRTIKM